jgi:hypothetical protein
MRHVAWIAAALWMFSVALRAQGGTPLPDGSFENGAPPDSLWTETTDHPADCPTGIFDSQAVFQAKAPDGVITYWAGGFCNGSTPGAITGSVSQIVDVPVDDPSLELWYLGYRSDANEAPLSDVAYISVDGTDVWTRDASTGALNTWNTAHSGRCFRATAVDLGAYAGQQVELELGMRAGAGNGVGNVVFDDLRFGSRFSADSFECGDLSAWAASTP